VFLLALEIPSHRQKAFKDHVVHIKRVQSVRNASLAVAVLGRDLAVVALHLFQELLDELHLGPEGSGHSLPHGRHELVVQDAYHQHNLDTLLQDAGQGDPFVVDVLVDVADRADSGLDVVPEPEPQAVDDEEDEAHKAEVVVDQLAGKVKDTHDVCVFSCFRRTKSKFAEC